MSSDGAKVVEPTFGLLYIIVYIYIYERYGGMSSDGAKVVEPTFGLLYIIVYERYGGYVLWGGYVPRSKWWLRSVLEAGWHSGCNANFSIVGR
jgi:hypothetical protein